MERTLPEHFSTRPATLDDAEAAVELVNACSVALIGKPEFEAHQFRTDWASPNLNPVTDLHLVFTPDDRLVGYAGVWDGEPFVQLFGWGNVHPDFLGQGIGTHLAQWVEERARQSVIRAPQGARVVLLQSRLGIDTAAQGILLQQGYQLVRYSFRMLIEMECPPPEPIIYEGITIRIFDRRRQLRDLIMADREIFRDHWGYVESPFEEDYREWEHWIDNDPEFDPALWYLAMEGDEIAGLSLCHLKTAEDPDMGYIGSLGVRRDWRRRGLGLALLHHSFGELYRRGKRSVALDVDAQSLTGATRLYEKAGMHIARQTVLYEKELQTGVDLRTESLIESPNSNAG